jgi:hypothetical protein
MRNMVLVECSFISERFIASFFGAGEHPSFHFCNLLKSEFNVEDDLKDKL